MSRTNDYIKITNLRVYAYHGVLEEEKEEGQEFFLNAKIYIDMRKPGMTDDLNDTLNYDELCDYLQDLFREKTFDLIEAAAEYTVQEILFFFKQIQGIELEVRKPHAPVTHKPEDISVTIYREWHKTYLSIGSNYKNSCGYLNEGIYMLKELRGIKNVRRSELVITEPYGPVEQDNFTNLCVEMDTYLHPEELLVHIHEIEDYFERDRSIKWGPRPFDADILFYDNWVYDSETLHIPHVELQNRMFVLDPLEQIVPWFRHPITGKTVAQMKKELEEKGYEDTIVDRIVWDRQLNERK